VRIEDILAPLSSVVLQNELDLSQAVADCLRERGVAFEREVRLNDADRIDYLVGRVGVELKLHGSVSAIARQLSRYAQSDQVDALILVTTRMSHRSMPSSLNQKPITVVYVGGWL
jgi:hypothetical protein